MRTPAVEFVQREDGSWFFRVRAANGRLLNHRYNRLADAQRGFEAQQSALATGGLRMKVVPFKSSASRRGA